MYMLIPDLFPSKHSRQQRQHKATNLEKLGLGCRGIAKHENIDVTTQACAVREDFA